MSTIIGVVDTSNTYTTGTQTFGQINILLEDADTRQPVNGYGAVVNYVRIYNGTPIYLSQPVMGQSFSAWSGLISDINPQNQISNTFAVISISQPSTPYLPPEVSDIAMTVSVDKPESAPGARDAQLSIKATSSYGPIQYSDNNGATWQSSPVFAALTGGLYEVVVKDNSNFTTSTMVTVPVLSSLLVSDPSVDLGNGNISRWSAAFNPVVFTFQRKDFELTSAAQYNDAAHVLFTVNATLLSEDANYSLQQKDLVYINAGAYKGVYPVVNVVGTNGIVVETPWLEDAAGFININRLRPYYYIKSTITYQDPVNGSFRSTAAQNRPDSAGLVRADISNFLQSLLAAADNSDYTQINYPDNNLSASYQLSYNECWDDGTDDGYQSSTVVINNQYYVVYAAKQLGERYGGNLAAYVPFPAVNDSSKLARWVTDFVEPAYSNGYPFDIGFIYSEAIDGLQLFCHVLPLDINRQPLDGGETSSYLLNDDGSWLLNQDGSKFVISRQSATNASVPAQVGLNRLLISDIFPPEAYYFNLSLQYTDSDGVTHAITQTQTVRIDDAVDDRSVYMRWIGLSGSWNYYRFVYNQEVSLDVQNATIIKNYVSDWENQQGIEEVIYKEAGQKMKLMAEDLSVSDIKGLQSIKYSPKVQMLVNSNPVKWQTIVINTATFAEYETMNGQAPFSITFNMPSINIQAQ